MFTFLSVDWTSDLRTYAALEGHLRSYAKTRFLIL